MTARTTPKGTATSSGGNYAASPSAAGPLAADRREGSESGFISRASCTLRAPPPPVIENESIAKGGFRTVKYRYDENYRRLDVGIEDGVYNALVNEGVNSDFARQKAKEVAQEVCAKFPPHGQAQVNAPSFRSVHAIPAFGKGAGDPLEFFNAHWRRHFESGEANLKLLTEEADNLRQAIYAVFRGQPGAAARFIGTGPKSDLNNLTAEQRLEAARAKGRQRVAAFRARQRGLG